MKKSFSHYLKNKYIILFIILIVIIIAFIVFSNNSNGSMETIEAKISSIKEKVSVTGKVNAINKAELSFEKAGNVSKINFKVGDTIKEGDIIASLDISDSVSQLRSSEANLIAEKAKLTEVLKGMRDEEILVEESKLKSAQSSFENSRITLINALHDSYIKTENALYNYSDIFFNNPQTVVPKINIRIENYNKENAINNSRLISGEKLKKWKESLDKMSLNSDPMLYINEVHSYLEIVKTFLSDLSGIVSDISPGNSGLSQSIIDSNNQIMNNSLSTFNTAISTLATAESAYKTASSSLSIAMEEYRLKKAGSSEEEIQIQLAKVDQANANVLNSQSELNKKRLISPFSGILAKIDLEIGKFVSIGEISAVVISNNFKVEVNVPESDIAKISIGNTASITLDAYGESISFPAHVVSIDMSETMIEGIPTYKVTLFFDEIDNRIRSGMTANIDIITNNKDSVISVPFRAIFDRNGEKYIKFIDNNNEILEQKVKIGIRGDNGDVEILEGVENGMKIVILEK